jgi:hypothetical protein
MIPCRSGRPHPFHFRHEGSAGHARLKLSETYLAPPEQHFTFFQKKSRTR